MLDRLRKSGLASFCFALALAAAVLFPFLGHSGIWDPFELDNAELARRIALHRGGSAANALMLSGETSLPPMPSLGDLGMGELPFTSAAAFLLVFGQHDWVVRLPLALWAFAGAMLLYVFLAQWVGRRAGTYGVVVLCTTPLFFVHARTFLGDVVTMVAVGTAVLGLAGLSLARSGPGRMGWAAFGLFGLAAGYLCRGLGVGVALPLLSVGVAMALSRGFSAKEGSEIGWLRDALSVVLCVGGLAATLGAVAAISQQLNHPEWVTRAASVTVLAEAPPEDTFDRVVRQLGHGLFPWSALLPFAMGKILVWPSRPPMEGGPGGGESPATADEAFIRLVLVVAAGFSWVAMTLLVPYTGNLPYPGVVFIAGIIALAAVELERRPASSRVAGIGAALLGLVLYRDFAREPGKALSAYVVSSESFPQTFEARGGDLLLLCTVLFVGVVAVSWFEAGSGGRVGSLKEWVLARTDAYLDGLSAIGQAWNGNLLFAFVVLEAGLIGLGGMLFFGGRLGWSPVINMPQNLAVAGLNAWWVLPLVAIFTIPMLVLVRDGYRVVFDGARAPRGGGIIVAGALGGAILAFVYYPALASQLSPKEVFEAYTRLHREGEPLALVGVRTRTANYYHRGPVETPTSTEQAYAWLTAKPDSRRWLIATADDLGKLNSLFRSSQHRNIPILDSRSSQVMLFSNQLGAGETNDNPLGRWLLEGQIAPQHPLDASFQDQLDALGWEVVDEDGQVVDFVVPQRDYVLYTYFQVKRRISSNWRAFVHIDGQNRRHNGDHEVLDGEYPMRLWVPGDIIRDRHEFRLEPNFLPGDYRVYFGFFSGKSRFHVTRGDHQEDRVVAGVLTVR